MKKPKKKPYIPTPPTSGAVKAALNFSQILLNPPTVKKEEPKERK